MGAATTLDAKAWNEPTLCQSARERFMHICWGVQPNGIRPISGSTPYQSYFRHYEQCCLHLSPSLQDFTHHDVCMFVRYMSHALDKTREEMTRCSPLLASRSSDVARDCVSFIGKAVLLLDLSKWPADKTLPAFIQSSLASNSTQEDQFRLPLSYNARTFERIAGIEIKWSRDLLSHLSVGLDSSSLTIFHHATLLDLYEHSRFGSMFPNGFISETRDTISLMLPVADKACREWFRGQRQRLDLDAAAGNCPYLRGERRHIQCFNFWRDRLIVSKEIFDHSQPSSILQFWRDDRNKVQWWTFWIAIVVFFLTVVGVIEGALQVYKAYHPTIL